MNFNSLNSEKCVYVSKSPVESIIVVYEEDFVILTKSQHDYEYIIGKLLKSLKMKDGDNLHYCLGIEFAQNRDNVETTQKKYIKGILCKNSKAVTTLLDNNVKSIQVCVLKLSKKNLK